MPADRKLKIAGAIIACAALAALPAVWNALGFGGPPVCGSAAAEKWISETFADAPEITGNLTGRTEIESPAWVRDAEISGGKYGLSLRAREDPDNRMVAITTVRITDLESDDRFGAGIAAHRDDADMELYLSDVLIEPDWPEWQSYDETNYDGIVLDGARAIYAQDVTIAGWNADSAVDNKAEVSQFAGLRVAGPGYRPLRYWRAGPHYLVQSAISKPGGGTLIWFKDCGSTTLFVHDTSFNDLPRLTEDMIACEEGANPEIVYLDEDPRMTGQMHPMFTACAPE